MDCDKNHKECSPKNPNAGPKSLPTRLIDVGSMSSENVRLCQTAVDLPSKTNDLKYLALSHRWGDRDKHKTVSTTTGNLNQHMIGIPDDGLPNTFKDAVKVTRELGIRYLWIDSLCIIQGEGGDFENESERMESVFSYAYCVITASRSPGSSNGFLLPRSKREFVKFETRAGVKLYACEAIDEFQQDVINGPLNQRGWVFQERALALRTIYFTEKQNYFECGNGVRCETLAKIRKYVFKSLWKELRQLT